MVLRSRRSQALTVAEVMRLWRAAGRAFILNVPLNWVITIHLGKLGSTDARKIIVAYLKRYGDWLKKLGGMGPVWVWVIENPPPSDFGKGGLHVHIVLHVAPELTPSFKGLRKRWLGISDVPKGAFHAEPLYYSSSSAWMTRRYLEFGLTGILRYLSKGVEAGLPDRMSLDRLESQGEVRGKRVGISEALGPARIRSIAWMPRRRWGIAPEVYRRRYLEHFSPCLLGKAGMQPSECPLGQEFELGASD